MPSPRAENASEGGGGGGAGGRCDDAARERRGASRRGAGATRCGTIARWCSRATQNATQNKTHSLARFRVSARFSISASCVSFLTSILNLGHDVIFWMARFAASRFSRRWTAELHLSTEL